MTVVVLYFWIRHCQDQQFDIDNDNDVDNNEIDTQAPEIDPAAAISADPGARLEEIQDGLEEEPAAGAEVEEEVAAGLEAPPLALPEIAAEQEIPEAVEVDVAEPAGSAGEPAGSAAPSDQSEVAVPAPAPPVPGIPRLRVHASPRQILEQASPNSTFTVGINHNDHRFYVKCKVKAADDDRLVSPYQNQSFSKTFYLETPGSWEQTLADVHDHCWRKWELIKSDYPADKEVQVPGRVPDYVIDQIRPHMTDKIPARKEYSSARSGVW